MKKLLIFLILITLTSILFGQKAMTFAEANKQGISIESLDRLYASGIHADTSLAVFTNNIDEYILAYQTLLKDLGDYLKQNNFIWEKPTNGFNRIYFRKDGAIDFFLYDFRPGQLTEDQEKKFGELLSVFIKDHRFALSADKKFAQCSPVTYMPSAK